MLHSKAVVWRWAGEGEGVCTPRDAEAETSLVQRPQSRVFFSDLLPGSGNHQEEVRAEQETQEPQGAWEAEPKGALVSTLFNTSWQAPNNLGHHPAQFLQVSGLPLQPTSEPWLWSEGQPA